MALRWTRTGLRTTPCSMLQGKGMEVQGTAVVWLIPDKCTKPRRVEGLVTPDMKEADILLSWVEMMKPCWGLLSEDFPAVKDQEESCKRTESRKKENGDGNSKFWAAQRSETFEERENRLNKELKEEMMAKYSSIFVEKLGEEDRILNVEAEIELKDD